jgi:phosphatidylglycerophosphate synthase
MLDGALARSRKLTSDTGRILDTGIDMVSGVLMLVAIASLTTLLNWWWVGILVVLYVVRFWFVLGNKDGELGGYKNALVVGFLIAYWRELDYTLIIELVAIYNIVVIGINLQKYQR